MPSLYDIARGVRSFNQGASNAIASSVSGPVDGLAWLLRQGRIPVPDMPVGGAEWMRYHGLTVPPENPLVGLLGEGVGLTAPGLLAGKILRK